MIQKSEAKHQVSRSTMEKAAEWFIRCTDDKLTADEIEAMVGWLRSSNVHLNELIAFLEVDNAIAQYFDRQLGRKRLKNAASTLFRAFGGALGKSGPKVDASHPRPRLNRCAAASSARQMRWVVVLATIVFPVTQGVAPCTQRVERILELTEAAISGHSWRSASVVIPQGATPNGIIIVSDPAKFEGIVQALKRDPRLMYDLSWRQWEEIVAAAWERFGYRVELTPRSADHGRDVIATRIEGIAIRIFDQVKLRAAHRVITADEVRAALCTVFMEQNVSKVFLTTTSRFAPGVYESPLIQQFVPYRLELRPQGPLLSWLSQARDVRVG
jgi:restriction system protein